MTSHVDQSILAAYLESTVNASTRAVVEAHLVTCAPCRADLADLAGIAAGSVSKQAATDPLQLWQRIEEEIDSPRTPMLRVLEWMDVGDHVGVILRHTPGMGLSLWAAVAVLAGLAFGAASANGDTGMVLLVAPILPVAAVATAFGPRMDPSFEISAAAPFSGFRLVLLRCLTALLVTVPVVAGVSAAAGAAGEAVLWILPSLALVSITLAGATRVAPEHLATVVGVGWAAVVVTVTHYSGPSEALIDSSLFDLSGQIALALVALLAAGVTALRRDRFDRLTQGLPR